MKLKPCPFCGREPHASTDGENYFIGGRADNAVAVREHYVRILTAMLRGRDTAQASAAEFPYSLHTATQTGLPNVPRVKTLLDRQARLRACCEAVERFAESIADDEVRTIVRLRFMAGGRRLSWQDIALKLGYRAEHTPRRKLTDYILHKSEP